MYMKIINLSFTLILIATLSLSLSADTWNIFWYMDSSDGLNDMAIKNITDMMRGKPNDTVNVRIQLHAYFDAGLRYHATQNSLEFLEAVTLTGNSKQDFIDAATWALADNDADHTMLIIANHGWGILDPHWNDITNEWEVDAGGLSNQCMIKRGCLNNLVKEHKRHRGFMFSVTPRVYLTNQDLVDGLAIIKADILHGKKIDILAFDTCMGDMFEIAYLVAPYADYLVGNQSCSLLDGFDYHGVMNVFNQGLTPRNTSAGMVRVFDAYYGEHDASGIYTHAALDLSHIYAVSNALDAVVAQLLNMPELAPLFVQARNASPRFCLWPMYTDLISFCKCIEAELVNVQPSYDLSALQAALDNLYAVMPSLVVARCGGSTTQGLAHGVAIYLPPTAVDASYYGTRFVHESQWVKLLELICN